MHSSKRIKITDVNPHLICVLCGGYYIDATTIIECLHSFCKSCIVRYLQKNKYCPICDVQVHKTSPLLNIRSDRTLQNIVYKLVPNLFKNEMERRVTFYEKYPAVMPELPEERGEVTDTTPIFFPDELLIICLEYQIDKNTGHTQLGNQLPKRYLHCPAAITVSHLAKLIRGKFGLSQIHHVSLFFKDDLLQDDITIMDIAYTYQCRRKMPIHLTYRILELKKKTIKLMPPIPPDKSDTSAQSSIVEVEEAKEKKDKDSNFSIDDQSKNEVTNIENNKEVTSTQTKSSKDLVKCDTETEPKEISELRNEHDVASSSVKLDDNILLSSKTSEQTMEVSVCEENKNFPSKGDKEKMDESVPNKDKSEADLNNDEVKEDQTSSTETAGPLAEGEWKEVQLQISENGVMSVRNMKSSECSPKPAVEAPNCPVSHPTTSQASSVVTTSKLSFSSVPQNRSNEPIVSVSKVSKDQVKKEVNNTMVSAENKLSISRVASPATGTTVAKGDVLNRIVSKLSPNETVIGNTGVTIRPVTKVYPGMKSIQERKPRAPSNHMHRYKTLSQTSRWNPNVDRSTMLSLKKQNCDITRAPRFFKMRNTPRYLGNPAEGVKPLYGGGGRQENSSPKQSPPKSPVKQPPPYTPRGQDKPPPPYTPRPAHTGCGGATTYLPHSPYHLLYSGFPFSGASPELLRSMCASTAYHPSLPPMLYSTPGVQQVPPRQPTPTSPHDFKSAPVTTPSIQRIPSSLSPKPPQTIPSVEDKKRDLPPPSSSYSSAPVKGHKPLENKPPLLPPLPIPMPPPSIISLSDKSSTSITNNNNIKESLLSSTALNQHPLK